MREIKRDSERNVKREGEKCEARRDVDRERERERE